MKTSSALIDNHYSQDGSSHISVTSPPQLDLATSHHNGQAPVGKSPRRAGDMKDADPQDLMKAAWQQVMEVLQSELSAPAYSNYLRHIQPIELGVEK